MRSLQSLRYADDLVTDTDHRTQYQAFSDFMHCIELGTVVRL
jgi:hypothetical protein